MINPESIAQALRDSTVTDGSFHLQQDELRVAEKQSILANQRRKELLNSLREQVNKVSKTQEQRTVRIIRDGLASEVESLCLQFQREIKLLLKKKSISKQAAFFAHRFSKQSAAFVNYKKLLETIEKKLDTVDATGMSEQAPREKMITLASSLRSNMLELMQQLQNDYESFENQSALDTENEKKNRTLFYSFLSLLKSSEQKTIVPFVFSETKNAGIEKRTEVYRLAVEKLVTTNEQVAQMFHQTTRQQVWDKINQAQYQRAEEELLYANKLSKNDPQTYKLLIHVYRQSYNKTGELNAMLDLLKLQPDDTALQRRIADRYFDMGMPGNAEPYYTFTLKHFPGDFSIRRKLGECLYYTRKYKSSAEVLKPYMDYFLDDKDGHKWIGISYWYLNQTKLAIHHLDAAVQHDPNDIQSAQYLALSYKKLMLHKVAITFLKRMLRTTPNSLTLIVLLATTYLENNQLILAVKYFKEALRLQPRNASLHISLGQVLNSIGQPEEALFYIEKAAKLDPGRKDIMIELIKTYNSLNDPGKVESLLSTIAIEDINDAGLLDEIGMHYLQGGEWEKAKECMQKAADIKRAATS